MIISGGQTGVDQAALEFALNNSVYCSGWCPAGRRSEVGKIPVKYPLIELKSRFYPPRTRRNIESSDATLIIYSEKIDGGTKLTLKHANKKRKPVLCLQYKSTSVDLLLDWLEKIKPAILNVAGPRFSACPHLFEFTIELLSNTLEADTDSEKPDWPPKRAINLKFENLE